MSCVAVGYTSQMEAGAVERVDVMPSTSLPHPIDHDEDFEERRSRTRVTLRAWGRRATYNLFYFCQ